MLEDVRRRERSCAEKEERCDLILGREAMLESGEGRLRDDRAKLDNERRKIRESIAEQVNRETDRERQRLEEAYDRRWEKGKRILFTLCLGVCSFAVPMLAIVMQNRLHILAATLPDWLEARRRQFAAFGQWSGGVGARLGGTLPQGWWSGPLSLLPALILIAAVCVVVLLAVGYATIVKRAASAWMNEGTLAVHAILWTLTTLAGFALADRLAAIPNSPMHWLDWWILLSATTHPVYLLAIAPKISQFITGNQS